ncbi:protein singles bar [Lutzomyia longipalpis]|uniref:protein singles bar n=1 Tax=Lutzomyia longipalpis TaxID=7200 RepID=UPI002483D939|nr:protein singles bar [Lutzomyia longipalpis]
MPQTVITMRPVNRETPIRTGIKICYCRMFHCLQPGFFTSKYGLMKLFECLMGIFCQSLVFTFGLDNAKKGFGWDPYFAFLSATSACLPTTALLLLCYTFSVNTFRLVRSSIFEIVFNIFCAFCYISASGSVAYREQFYQNFTKFFTGPGDYTSLTTLYFMGGLMTIIYSYDAFLAFRSYNGNS